MRAREPGCVGLAPLRWLGKAVARLPQPALLALGAVLTPLLRPLTTRRRRYARQNLDACFPQWSAAERARLLRRNLQATVTGALELMRAWYAPDPVVQRLGSVQGIDHLHAALAGGRGVLLLGAHFVHSELAARLLSVHARQPLHVMVRRNNHRCLERLFDRARRGAFAGTLAKKDVRGLLKVLARGGVVAYSADQNFTYQNAFVPFFGVAASTLTTTPELARRAGAVVLPMSVHRDAAGAYHVRLQPTWSGWPSGDAAADAARYMAELEAVVRQHPEQYLWVHRRFKTRPPGAPPIYS